MKLNTFSYALIAALIAGLTGFGGAWAQASHEIIITQGDITDRPYRVIGDVSVTVPKAALFDKIPIEEKAANALKEKAATMRADAVIQVRYESSGFEFTSLGHMEAHGQAVVFENGPRVGVAGPTAPSAPAMTSVQTPSQSQMKAALQSYIGNLNAGNAAAVIALYSDNATVEDPVGSAPKKGQKAIETFVHDAIAAGVKYELVAPIRGSNTDAAAITIRVRARGAVLNVTEIFTFFTDGKIGSMKAYWGSEDREAAAP